MKRTGRLQVSLVFSSMALSIGCGTAVPGDSAPKRIAAGCPDQSAVVAGPEKPPEAPPNKFYPRAHPSRVRPVQQRSDLDLAALPALKMRLGKCFPKYMRKDAQIAVGQKPSTPGTGGVASSQKVAKKRARPKSKKATPGGPVPGTSAARPAQEPAAQPAMVEAEDSAAPSSPAERPSEALALESAPAKEAIAADGDEGALEPPPCEPAQIAGPEEQEVAPPVDKWSEFEDWGAAIYLSNDDTMSLSSAQRVIYAIDNFLPLPPEHIRPHELLNYFSFETASSDPASDFSVLADVAPDQREPGIYTLALAVKGRPVTKATRRNVGLTLVVDRSGSMEDEGRMDFLKQGLGRMVSELKTGDMVHMVLFDDEVCTPVENFVVGRDPQAELTRAIDALEPRGSTDLHLGLTRGYEIADRAYQPEYSNRVVMITDALANTGVTDAQMISTVSKYYDSRRIRLTGVGVGREFNDELLDRLTERGKGAYVFLGSAAEVDAVFGRRFISLIETTALDVHFLVHLPGSLRMNVFYGEESSTVKEDVQAIHYFANSTQLFLSDLMAYGGEIRDQDDVMITVEYEEPETGEELFEEYAFNLGEIRGDAYNVKKGRLIMAWIDLLAQMAARPVPSVYSYRVGSWIDEQGWQTCDQGREELAALASGLERDNETIRVLELWEKYCARYERPRNPTRRERVSPTDSWPGAEPEPPRKGK